MVSFVMAKHELLVLPDLHPSTVAKSQTIMYVSDMVGCMRDRRLCEGTITNATRHEL